jgi:hypothetical protein
MPKASVKDDVPIDPDEPPIVEPPVDPLSPWPIQGDVTVPFTCPWAQDGLRKAMDGMSAASSGVFSYGVGSRRLHYKDAPQQAKAVDYWQKMVEYYCGTEALPPAITGRDTAFRVINRDL